MDKIIAILLITSGALIAVVQGILGKGLGFGRSKFIYEKFGSGVAKVVKIVTGLILMAAGILLLLYPQWLGQK